MVSGVKQNVSFESQNVDSVLAGFAQECREHAALTAQNTLNAGKSATLTILQMAAWIQEMRSELNRKEFGAFVKQLLQWVGDEARPYLDIARTFKDFDLTRLEKLEPFTLLKLRSKRYEPVVQRLREESDITPQGVQELISDLIPKRQRTKRASKEHAKPLLERHADVKSGTFYYTLKEVNLSDRVGSWLETKLETQTIGQILASATSMPPNDDVRKKQQEVKDMVEKARTLETENKKLAQELQKRERRIAELEELLAKRASSTTATPKDTKQASSIDDNGISDAVEQDDKEDANPRQLELSSIEHAQTWKEVEAVVGCDRNQLLETVKTWTLERRQVLVKLLSAYLKREPNSLEHIAWIPKKLLDRALSTLSFKIRRIGGPNNLVDEPKIEYILCSFVSLDYPDTRREQWIFRDGNNKLYPVFGRDEIQIVS